MGIVLTPRHVTKFATEADDMTLKDVVLGPTCGTGGFLVAAFYYIKAGANTTQIDMFKWNNVFGIDNQPHDLHREMGLRRRPPETVKVKVEWST